MKSARDQRLEVMQRAFKQAASGEVLSAFAAASGAIASRRFEVFEAPELADEIDDALLDLAAFGAAHLGAREDFDQLGHAIDRRRGALGLQDQLLVGRIERAAICLQSGWIADAERILIDIDTAYPAFALDSHDAQHASAVLDSRPWSQLANSAVRAEMARTLGLALMSIGKFEAALAFAEAGAALFAQAKPLECENLTAPSTFNLRAKLLALECSLWLGDAQMLAKLLPEARQLATVAEEEDAAAAQPALLELNRIEAMSAHFAGRLGEAGEALERLIKRASSFSPLAMLTSAINYAEYLLTVNQTPQARELLERAQGSLDHLPEPTRSQLYERCDRLVKTTNRLAACMGQSVAPPNATIYSASEIRLEINSFVSVPERLGTDEDATLISNVLGAYRLALHATHGAESAALARNALDDLEPLLATTDSPLLRGLIAHAIGALRLAEGNTYVAEALLRKALTLLASDNALLPRVDCLRLLAALQTALGHGDTNADTEAHDLLRRLQASLKTPEERDVFMLGREDLAEQVLLREVAVLQSFAKCLSADKGSWHALHSSKQTFSQSRTGISDTVASILRLSETWWRACHVDPIDLKLASDLAVLRLIPTARGIVAVLTTDNSTWWQVAPVLPTELRRICRDWHVRNASFLNDVRAVGVSAARPSSCRALDDLFGELFSPLSLSVVLSELPARIRRVRVLAHDALNTMPFEAAPYRDGYLHEYFEIEHGVDAAWYPSNKPSITSGMILAYPEAVDAVALGDETKRQVDLPAIEQVIHEADALKSCWEQQDLKAIRSKDSKDADVRLNDAIHALRKHERVHFASHGQFFPDRPDESGIVIASRCGGVARILSIRRLLRDAKKIRARHVGLSACFSADALCFSGRRVCSLQNALCIAGVETVAAFLWPVYDQFAAEVFTQYYTSLGNSAPAVAVAETRKRQILLSKKQPARAHPHFWAALTVWVPINAP